MRWNVRDNDPPIANNGGKIFCDDQQVRYVVAFDTDEGLVEAHCTDGHTGHPGRRHIDPRDPDRACKVTLRGVVRYEPPR